MAGHIAHSTHDDVTRYRFFSQLTALPSVQAIYLYGSRAKGVADEWADVDLAISAPHMSDALWADVERIAEGADILVPVQPIWLEHVPEGVFRREIEKDKLLLWQRGEA